MRPLAFPHAARRTAFARPLLVLVLVLVLVQTLGLMHRIVHLHGRMQTSESPAAGVVGDTGESWVKALFEGHDSERDCAQYDQSSHGDLAWGGHAMPLTMVSAFSAIVQHPGWHLAAQAAGFLARGPPATA